VKVLVAHNRYRSALPSGENVAVEEEISALERAGVQVVPYLRSSDEITELPMLRQLAVPFLPIHSPAAVADVRRLIDEHRVDVVHLHNPYPFISLSVVRTAHDLGVPVVVTLHNHRHSCVRGSFFRDGHACTLCQGRTIPWPAVRHGCYRDSRVQSVPMVAALAAHRRDQRAVDRWIALSDPVADSILASGLTSPERVVVRPNSVRDPGPAGPPGRGLLFVGRLTVEKGLQVLLQAWQLAHRPFGTLIVVGEGPLAREAAQVAAADPTVRVMGRLDPEAVAKQIRAAAALVVPSTAPEALPLVVLEAYAHGRPVLASDRGGLAAAVDPAVGWLSAPTGPALAEAMRTAAADDLAARGAAARGRYLRTYAPSVVIGAQLEIYRQVIAESRSRPTAPGRGPQA